MRRLSNGETRTPKGSGGALVTGSARHGGGPCTDDGGDAQEMSRQLEIKGRQYWVLSEPEGDGWKARVVEVCADGSSDEMGIDSIGETRGDADAAAERKLRRLLEVC